MKSQTYVILTLIFIIIVAIFAIVNVDPVEVNYVFWSGYSPLILVILISVLMGGIITAFTGTVKMYKLQRELKQLKRENMGMKAILNDHGLSLDEKVKHKEKVRK